MYHKNPGGGINFIEETYYIRDASGNIMATYTLKNQEFKLNELHIYGSSRLGLVESNMLLNNASGPVNSALPPDEVEFYRGYKRYELSNHLGNVLAVVSDKRTLVCISGTQYYEAEIISASDYYPFGMVMEERSYTATVKGYRFGFNGKEMDDETFDGAIAFEARIYDSRLGRFFSTDPWEHKYSWQSTYSYYKNCPISILDFLGKGGEDDPPKSSGGGLNDFLKKVTKDGQITDEDDIGQASVSVHAKGYSDFKKWRRRTSRNIKSGCQNISHKAPHFLGSANDFVRAGGSGQKAAQDYYDGLVIGGDNFRSSIEYLINETADGNFEPIFNTIYPPIGMQSGDNFEPISLPSNATELGEASFSVIPIVLTKGRNAKNLDLVKVGTKEWQTAVQAIRNNKKSNIRVATATDARNLLFEAQGNMNRYKHYAKDKGVTYKKGFETHNNQNSREINVGNDLQHIKWKNGKGGGHIFYDQPN